MPKITRNNYESYFLDFLEGNLNSALEADLRSFLEENPDLHAELEMMREIGNPFNEAAISDTVDTLGSHIIAGLKKPELPISEDDLIHLIIGRLENNISEDEKKRLETLEQQYPEVRREVALFSLTKIHPNPLDRHISKDEIKIQDEVDPIIYPWSLIALVEGDLTSNDQKDLLDKIASSEQLRSDYEFFKITKAPIGNEKADLTGLKIPSKVDLNDPTLRMIALLEGDLAPKDASLLLQKINASSQLSTEFARFQNTKLSAPAISFDQKALLYQKAAGRVIAFRTSFQYIAAAASVALLIWLGIGKSPSSATMAGNFQIHNSTLPVHSTSNDSPNKERIDSSNLVVDPIEFHSSTIDRDSYANNSLPNNHSVEELIITPISSKGSHSLDITIALPYLASDMDQKHTRDISDRNKTIISPNPAAQSIWQYAERKAKEKVWGDENYPDDHFVLALAEKQIEKRFGSDEVKMQLERVLTPEAKEFRFRLGRFKYSRNRKNHK